MKYKHKAIETDSLFPNFKNSKVIDYDIIIFLLIAHPIINTVDIKHFSDRLR